MADIFISYSQKDRDVARALADFLDDHGYDVWWDRDLLGGESFRDTIKQQLTKAKTAIVIWTPNSVQSDWVIGEADAAKRAHKLIATRIDGFDDRTIPSAFRDLQTDVVTAPERILHALKAMGVLPSRPPKVRKPDPVASDKGLDRDAMAYWESIKDSEAPTTLERYIAQFPESRFATLAASRLRELAAQAWDKVSGAEDVAALQDFVRQFPHDAHAIEAKRRIDALTGARRRAPPIKDVVEFGASHPAGVRPGEHFIVEGWIFHQYERDAVERQATEPRPRRVFYRRQFLWGGAAPVARGTRLAVKLELGSWEVKPSVQTLTWTGSMTRVLFEAAAPIDLPDGVTIGTVSFFRRAMRIGEVKFELALARSAEGERRHTPGRALRSAFASYASKDRLRVLTRVHGIEKARIDVFMDVRNIKSNDPYPTYLLEKIDSSDILYLFWSRHAKDSEWVEREWRYGLERKGLDFIDPVPLVDPRKVPPPPELGGQKHFNDWVLKYIEAEKGANPWRRLVTWLAGDD